MRYTFIFLLLSVFVSCTSESTAQAQVQSGKVNVAQFEQLIAKGNVQLIDVRTPEEYKAGHLKGATNIDFYATDFAARMKKLDANKPVLVYCAVGGRSGSAASKLSGMGFKQIYDLQGGIRAWASQGKQVVQ
ncbi:MAG: rhodanese-like domain-containing protein [Saprospiraceae bacterium]